MKYKAVLPFVILAVIVFVAVSSAFLCHSIFTVKDDAVTEVQSSADYVNKNIFVSISDSESNTMDINYLVNFDPKNKNITMINIPSSTRVRIASSDQVFRDVLNIGGIGMVRDVLRRVIPLPVDYHIVIKSDDFQVSGSDDDTALKYVLSELLWEQEDISAYLSGILSISNTDLTLVNAEAYAGFVTRFAEHTNEYQVIPGRNGSIGDKLFYITDFEEVNDFVNSNILDQ